METTSTPRKKSFEDYLHDVAGESQELDDEDEEELQRLNVAMNASEDNKSTQSRTSQRKQRGTPLSATGVISPQLTEAQSFVNDLLSPFSPLLQQKDQREDFLEFVSLQPCRKVSVVVRVLPCGDDVQRCLFPHVKATNPLIHIPKSPHDMVVVKPSAFGKVIPSSVTMETARLVAQVAHISSEDWARLYEFHHVMWPSSDEATPNADQFRTMDSLSRAVVQDALVERQSSLLISMGHAPTCVGNTYDPKNCQLSKIIAHCQRLMEPKTVATISMVELTEGKTTFRDLLNRRNTQVSIRHVDMRGAVLEGLSQIPIDEMHNHWPTTQTSTVVATINVWDNAVSHEMNREPDSQITCVEMTRSLDTNTKGQNKSSTVSLGLALRQLLRHSPYGTDPVISFRESTITKVLQRSLEASKIVLLASVSQLSQDYENTLTTLNFLRSLLVKQGKTASSPFPKEQKESAMKTEETATMTDRLQEYVTDETILQQITADPRQRLAKIMKPSPSKKPVVDIETAPSVEEDYNPIDYMQGLDNDEPSWHSPAPTSRQDTREPSSSIRNEVKHALPVAAQQTLQDDWSMEEPNDVPAPYPSFSESSQEESPQSNSMTPQGEGHVFDYDFGDGVAAQQNGDGFSMEGLSPTEELFPDPSEDHYSFDRSEGGSFDPGSAQTSIHGEIYDDEQSYEEMFGAPDDLEEEELSMQPLDQSSQGSNDLLSLVQHEYDQQENDAQSEASGDLRPDNDISHEIIFGHEVEDDNDSIPEKYEQPKMWSDTEDIENEQDDLPEDSLVHDQSIDESLISRESHSTFPLAAGRTTSEHSKEHENMHDPTIVDGVRHDGQSRKRSAFEAVSPLRPDQSSLCVSERSLRNNAVHDNAETTNSGDIQVLEGAVGQIKNMQSALWRSSEESLARLSDALNTQRGEMKLLEDERNFLASSVSSLKSEIRRMSEEHDARLRRYEEEVQVLEARNQVALASRRELQSTLDRTNSVGDEAKSRVEQLEQELQQTKKELLSSHESHRSVLDSRKELQNEANALKMENDELRHEKERIERNRAMAEQSLSIVEQENAKLLEATTSREVEVRELSRRLKQREKDQEELKDKFRQLEADRRQESLELEKLKFSLKSLEASLEDSEKEKTSAEEGRLNDKRRIEVLENELRERSRMYDDLLTENRVSKAHSRDLEQKLVFAGDEARTQESTIGRLKERCQSLEDKMNETCSDRAFWEDQTKQLNRTVEKLEEETRVLSMEKRTLELKAQQLEERLSTGDELARGDVDRLRVKYLQSERDRQELETLLTRYKTEYFDEEQKKSRELVNYKHRVEELEQECRLAQQREAETASTKESTISTLQDEVATCSANLDRANKKCSDLEVDVQKAEERLLAMTEKLDRYRHELIKSREEIDTARDKNSSQTALQIQSLTARIVELEEQLMTATQERDRSLKRSREDDSTIRLLSADLDNARDELLAKQRDIHRLQSDLSDSESAKKEQEAKMAELKAMMDKFQARAKAQFGAFAEEHQDLADTLEALRGDKENLRARLRKAEMERDACFTCLKDGREKLSDVIHRGKAGDFLEAEIFVNSSADIRSLPTKVSRRPSADLYLTDNTIDQLLALRAEEIAGCLALSARETIRGTQDENSSLRFRLNSMEVDKRAEVATLKNRIRDIEEDLRGGSVFSRR